MKNCPLLFAARLASRLHNTFDVRVDLKIFFYSGNLFFTLKDELLVVVKFILKLGSYPYGVRTLKNKFKCCTNSSLYGMVK